MALDFNTFTGAVGNSRGEPSAALLNFGWL